MDKINSNLSSSIEPQKSRGSSVLNKITSASFGFVMAGLSAGASYYLGCSKGAIAAFAVLGGLVGGCISTPEWRASIAFSIKKITVFLKIMYYFFIFKKTKDPDPCGEVLPPYKTQYLDSSDRLGRLNDDDVAEIIAMSSQTLQPGISSSSLSTRVEAHQRYNKKIKDFFIHLQNAAHALLKEDAVSESERIMSQHILSVDPEKDNLSLTLKAYPEIFVSMPFVQYLAHHKEEVDISVSMPLPSLVSLIREAAPEKDKKESL